MANIRATEKDGKTVSYRFTTCLGRDADGKQIRRYTTWAPPIGLTPAKKKKAAERAADAWEETIKAEYNKGQFTEPEYTLPTEKRLDSFTAFVNDVWFPLKICNGNCKQTSIAFYKNITKPIVQYFEGKTLQEISSIQIQQFLTYMGTEYKTSFLHIEITESLAIHDNAVMEKVKTLHDMGFKIELDDFGAGYSSLGTLQNIPMDIIKLDMSFARNIRRQEKIVRMIIALSHELGHETVAECVENAEQLRILQELGCDSIQGYYFSGPLSENEFREYLIAQEAEKV